VYDLKLLSDRNLDAYIHEFMNMYRNAKSINAKRLKLKLIELKIGLACKEWKRRYPNTLPPCFIGGKAPDGLKIYSWPK